MTRIPGFISEAFFRGGYSDIMASLFELWGLFSDGFPVGWKVAGLM